ncbi:hypothetical protein GCM10007907_39420 [Chitinimonas prasina]|uniref:Uncharacterized protein n=1 Tax=Chitinimonas prasina TaxID=1434937 RepID=A0ABQ5YJF6_9NEIS|nr:hypothetical protein [Chitinimonas prasina]GLR15152.1 hypothetical protein GCM10007907_39420 [Chitinimonas prasina]
MKQIDSYNSTFDAEQVLDMDVPTIWELVGVAGGAITAVICFAIHLRTVKKLQLEIVKLTLETENLKRGAEERERMLVMPSTQEVRDIQMLKFYVSQSHENYTHSPERKTSWLNETTWEHAVLLGIVTVIAYLIFAIYRVIALLLPMLS